MSQKITPFLWFDGNAEEAMNFYVSVFQNGKITGINRAGPNGPVMGGSFTINGQDFMVLNGGPHFKFNEAVSFFVGCEIQAEIDYYWEKLTTNGGQESRCGWLKDKFGLSWQIVPSILGSLLGNPDPAKAQRAMQAMLSMNKLDIEKLKNA